MKKTVVLRREQKLKYFSIITIKRQMLLQDKKKHTECVLSQFSDVTGAE